jgi:putative pyoverdin transport system ATP-binding/permease protein
MKFIICILISLNICVLSFGQIPGQTLFNKVDKEVRSLMDEGKIPGLSLVIIHGNQQIIKTYGHADVSTNKPVTPNTLFQIGSCTKAFTALAVMQLANAGSISLNANVTDYIPWFKPTYKDSLVNISVRQLLHHTSGIPWQSIALIPESNDQDALEKTIRKIENISLRTLPGKKYEYATINYDVLALIIQKVTQQPFEEYVTENIFNKLQLQNTTIGQPADSSLMSTGYRISYFKPRAYEAPVFKGNNAAGYVISNAHDMGKWLQLQLGLNNPEIQQLVKFTHQRDETVPLHDMNSYAMGWEVSLNGNGEIFHGGLNPNFTAYVALRPAQKSGIVVLANSNSSYTPLIGNRIMKLISGKQIKKEAEPGDGGDSVFSLVSFAMGIYILVVLAYLVLVIRGIVRGKRAYEKFTSRKLQSVLWMLAILAPFVYGLYILPKAVAGFTWETIAVWTPVSFVTTIFMIAAALAVSYLSFMVTMFFPDKNEFKRVAPGIMLASILAGLSNMVVIILLTSSQDTDVELKYLVFYFSLSLTLYLFARSFFQKNLVRFTRNLIYDFRLKLVDKMFSTSFQKFEKIDRGRVYTALNDDVNTIGEAANMFVLLITSLLTALGAFIYLASIALWATVMILLFIISVCLLYYFVSKSADAFYEQARDSRNVFMRLINGLVDGFKEISLHRNKKLEYKADLAASAYEYKEKRTIADIKFVNSFMVGESMLIFLLGIVAFALPELFPYIRPSAIMSFIIVVLYLGGSINQIVTSVPTILQVKIAWNRIQQFLKEIPANLDLSKENSPVDSYIDSINAKGITFQYKNKTDHEKFGIGPINLEVKRGEILFIIGGNGSGKTTLAKLLTGLYEPDEGKILINGKTVENGQLSEYFSTVFNPSFLFEKLYNINIRNKQHEVQKYLKVLNLEEKIVIEENRYSTINLSGGQRKRLALLQCYLEDSPIYLFDEWAADQDPGYRNFFYRTLLPEMRKEGKIIIAITHDDNYFDVADKIMKMKDGKLEHYTDEPFLTLNH